MTSTTRTTAATPLCLVVAMLALAGRAQAQAPLLEVEKSDATKLLTVTDDAGFLIRGELGSGIIPGSGDGVRMMWYPGKAAFRAGGVEGSHWDESEIGQASVALGANTRARGDFSLALNNATEASGPNSIAGGFQSTASGPGSLAFGVGVKATGPSAVALGDGTGAAGAASVALGSGVTTNGDGSFVFGDRNTNNPIAVGPNQFAVRAQGGIGFTSGPGTGCDLAPNSGAWACASSKLVKEEFEEVDGEDVLARLKAIPIQSWRYIGTSARHIGPFAEDFRAAFGLGSSPDKIAQIDADGVALRAVQALERRTAELQAENAALRRRVEALESSASSISSPASRVH